ncbi:arginine--tRNA ligase [Paenarthrobacter sp. NPDC089989]|uniref:arginine--tRNA ligase n=1 Tax=unclassified Paenarthrobacter TaxID=2634190 RepID=UPI00381EF8EC
MAAVFGAVINSLHPGLAHWDPAIRRSEHSDFQSNALFALAKLTGSKPRDLATDLRPKLDGGPIDRVELSGPGYLNISIRDEAIWNQIAARLKSPRLGIGAPERGTRTVIDYSAPNVAKEMHVGHLRTTIIGDCLARLLDFLGSDVLRQNHLGDWGTQFGMLIQYLTENPSSNWKTADRQDHTDTITALDALYKDARGKFDTDASFADRSRSRVVLLQSGDAETLRLWREIVAESEKAFHAIYTRLGVLLKPDDSVGESFYNTRLQAVINELVAQDVAVESDGALVIFSRLFMRPDGDPVPLIVRKRDGGYGYDTTDLATIRYRIKELTADRLLYVTDARQSMHFQMIFEAAKEARWLEERVQCEHVPYGMVLGPDGRPFKTRSGDTVRLMDLLDSAVARARAVVSEKVPHLESHDLDQIAESAGLAAVKYADLSTSRTKDYTFDLDRMVSFSGNTGVYLQYAHARICSILRKTDEHPIDVDLSAPLEPAERNLALSLDAYGGILMETARTFEPHRLCTYLYDTARNFTSFYEACNVLNAKGSIRDNRIAICQLTQRTLKHGLELLGISAPERM